MGSGLGLHFSLHLSFLGLIFLGLLNNLLLPADTPLALGQGTRCRGGHVWVCMEWGFWFGAICFVLGILYVFICLCLRYFVFYWHTHLIWYVQIVLKLWPFTKLMAFHYQSHTSHTFRASHTSPCTCKRVQSVLSSMPSTRNEPRAPNPCP